jgi:hypothetical protein
VTLLTYRSNPSGTLHAAHCLAVRVGYVEQRQFHRWRWQLSLVQSGGGHGFGVCDDEISARIELEAAFAKWLMDAGLTIKHQPTENPEVKPKRKRARVLRAL